MQEMKYQTPRRIEYIKASVGLIECQGTPCIAEDLAKLAEDDRIKMLQPQKIESFKNLLKSLSGWCL